MAEEEVIEYVEGFVSQVGMDAFDLRVFVVDLFAGVIEGEVVDKCVAAIGVMIDAPSLNVVIFTEGEVRVFFSEVFDGGLIEETAGFGELQPVAGDIAVFGPQHTAVVVAVFVGGFFFHVMRGNAEIFGLVDAADYAGDDDV